MAASQKKPTKTPHGAGAKASATKSAPASGRVAATKPRAAVPSAGATPRKPRPRPYLPAPRPTPVPSTTRAQERAAAEHAIEAAGLDTAQTRAVKHALRGAIDVFTRRVGADDCAVGSSHLGGLPDLPPGAEWPRAEGWPMSFVAQFRLDELAPFDADHALPSSGLLSFFIFDALPPKTKGPVELLGVAHAVLYVPDASSVHRVEMPADLFYGPAATAAVKFHTSFQLPSPMTPDHVALGPGVARVNLPYPPWLGRSGSPSQLLGYDLYVGYDAPPAPGTRNLFRCTSDGQAALNFGDAQDIAFRIGDDDLRALRFDRTRLWLQPG